MSQSSKRAARKARRSYVQERLARSGTTSVDYPWLKSIWQQVRS